MYKVLLVEDEEMIRKGLRYTFDWVLAGCVVVDEAENGQEGTEKILALRPDIVITDVGMPIKNGLEMLRETVDKCGYSAIIISVYSEFELAKTAIQLGVSEYLVKPLEHSQLLVALEQAKERVEMRRYYARGRSSGRSDLSTLSVLEDIDWDAAENHLVGKMVRYIEENYASKISINDLVIPLRASTAYLAQHFKEKVGYTFNEFLNRFRIQRAIQLMKKGEGKVAVIATEVGFSDYTYFIRVFKKYTDMVPGQFLKYFRLKSDEWRDADDHSSHSQ